MSKFYDGDVADESNFVGYGMLGFLLDLNCTAGGSTYATEIRLYGVQDDVTGFDAGLYDVDYTELDGFHFVCRVKAFTTRDPANMSGYSEHASGIFTTSASVNSLELYTYP